MYHALTLNGYSNFINAVKRQRNLGLWKSKASNTFLDYSLACKWSPEKVFVWMVPEICAFNVASPVVVSIYCTQICDTFWKIHCQKCSKYVIITLKYNLTIMKFLKYKVYLPIGTYMCLLNFSYPTDELLSQGFGQLDYVRDCLYTFVWAILICFQLMQNMYLKNGNLPWKYYSTEKIKCYCKIYGNKTHCQTFSK
jgi:hypothetical protein